MRDGYAGETRSIVRKLSHIWYHTCSVATQYVMGMHGGTFTIKQQTTIQQLDNLIIIVTNKNMARTKQTARRCTGGKAYGLTWNCCPSWDPSVPKVHRSSRPQAPLPPSSIWYVRLPRISMMSYDSRDLPYLPCRRPPRPRHIKWVYSNMLIW